MRDFDAGEVLLIDKPKGWTSFDVVKKVRNIIKTKKVGHAGTLDPLATGLLIICTGKKTKSIDQYQAEEKEYTGRIFLGATTASYDAETELENFLPYKHLSEEEIIKAAKSFEGNIMQMPPAYSAKWVDGKRAYDLARKGKEVNLNAVPVQIFAFEITKFELPLIDFKIICSKGTYIRSLAHDLGQKLACGAYLETLRRTRSGSFSVEQAQNMEQFLQEFKAN